MKRRANLRGFGVKGKLLWLKTFILKKKKAYKHLIQHSHCTGHQQWLPMWREYNQKLSPENCCSLKQNDTYYIHLYPVYSCYGHHVHEGNYVKLGILWSMSSFGRHEKHHIAAAPSRTTEPWPLSAGQPTLDFRVSEILGFAEGYFFIFPLANLLFHSGNLINYWEVLLNLFRTILSKRQE